MMASEEKSRAVFGTAVPASSGPVHAMSKLRAGVATDAARQAQPIQVGLLTAGNDRPYALGLASALASQGIYLDFIASDALDTPELHNTPLVNFLNLRGDQRVHVSFGRKVARLLNYYVRLLCYAAFAQPQIFHILWNNKFELLDRVLLMLYYKLLGKRIVFTAHNVNAAKRDGKDGPLNRLSLKFQYWMSDHIFVHTGRMKGELLKDFKICESKVTVIPFGINNTISTSEMTALEAKKRFGISAGEKTALFFGQIAPYKGLEYLIAAMAKMIKQDVGLRLIIAGQVKRGYAGYWEQIQSEIISAGIREQVIERIGFIPDGEVELYFKGADVVILPYVDIFQSGVPFLAYSFGLPVIATDVGSLREDVVEGKTGFICKPRDPVDLANKIECYFSSELYRRLEARRQEIRAFANEKYSWTKVGETTQAVYRSLLPERR
jgi:D-inositol-3-phosphate glycosyltransferase